MKCYTLGHSHLSIEGLVHQLRRVKIAQLVDIRSFPQSKRNPQFNKDKIRLPLEQAQIQYHWAGRVLGGMRQGVAQSVHSALEDESLRAYADHTQKEEFACEVAQLLNLIKKWNICLLCAEYDPLHCHRSILADYLLLQGVEVVHVQGDEALIHTLHPCARRESAELIYDRFCSLTPLAD